MFCGKKVRSPQGLGSTTRATLPEVRLAASLIVPPHGADHAACILYVDAQRICVFLLLSLEANAGACTQLDIYTHLQRVSGCAWEAIL